MGVRLLCFVVVVFAVLLFLCRYGLCDEKVTPSEDPYQVCLYVAGVRV